MDHTPRSRLAYPPGVDPGSWSRSVHTAHDDFLATGRAGDDVRDVVLDSWRRSLEHGVDPEVERAPLRLTPDELAHLRDGHPLASTMPVIRRLLVESAADSGLLVAVSDAAGRLLWVEGDHDLRTRAEQMHFVEGSDWSESAVGTNAPGTALALDRPVAIFGAEHLARPATPWSCSASPIHDPDTGAVLGALDVTGGADVAAPHTLALVRATAAAVESELRVQRLTSSAGSPATGAGSQPTRLDVLGAHQGLLRHSAGLTRLSLRHTEIVVLLAGAPDGLTADELAVALSDRDQPTVTVRAEMSRLRGALHPLALLSRPYRLATRLRTDVEAVRRALDQGDHRRAVSAYPGPVLPQSEAPGIARLRDDLHHRLRSALLVSGDADALLRFADTEHARHDLAIWEAAGDALGPRSARRAAVDAHVVALRADLA